MAQDMVETGFLRRVYCNNFQYNSNFTRRPRRQYSYEVTEMVRYCLISCVTACAAQINTGTIAARCGLGIIYCKVHASRAERFFDYAINHDYLLIMRLIVIIVVTHHRTSRTPTSLPPSFLNRH